MMSFHYCTLAIGRKPQFMDVEYAVPCDRHGDILPCDSELGEMKYWAKKVISYGKKDRILYCILDYEA